MQVLLTEMEKLFLLSKPFLRFLDTGVLQTKLVILRAGCHQSWWLDESKGGDVVGLRAFMENAVPFLVF